MALSRRDFFRSALTSGLRDAAQAAQQARARERTDFLYPPGAPSEPEFLAACTRCDACLMACPHEAIRRAGHEFGAQREGAPVIAPTQQPCWMCKDLPCISACTPGALRPLADPREARMGVIAIDHARCFAAQGSICDVCAERCPVRPKAVRVAFGEAPQLDTELCTGCAVCAWLCPAQAIDVQRATTDTIRRTTSR